MDFIDTHTHLFLPEFDTDRQQVVKRAIESGVRRLFMPNVDSATIEPLDNLAKEFPENIFPLMGLHPSSVDKNFEEELIWVEDLIKTGKYYGVGEIGIDLYWSQEFKNEQIKAFEYQIMLAKKYDLPIIIHARNSFEEIFSVVEKLNDDNLRGIFHCFTGSKAEVERIDKLENFMFGIGGVLTFKNSGLDKTVKSIDIEKIVLETDSPYLAPVPKRGKRNESSYITYIAEKLAEIKDISIQQVAEITTSNALKIFGL